MPKPGFHDFYGAVLAYASDNPRAPGAAARQVLNIVDAAWAEDEAERERGRKALHIVARYRPQHDASCHKRGSSMWDAPYLCTCGLDEALAALRGDGVPQDVEPTTDDLVAAHQRSRAVPVPGHTDAAGNQWLGCTVELPNAVGSEAAMWNYADEDQMERFNSEQRIRRVAYEEALKENTAISTPPSCAALAARRYPLKKRVPATVDDPGGNGGRWTYQEGSKFFYFHGPRDRCPSVHGPAWTAPRVRALSALLDSHWVFVDDVEVET